MQLAYFADPMCSWCYGFGPQLDRLLERHPEARLDLVMGGLRAFNREPMSAAFRAMLREHWAHVRRACGVPISEALLERDGYVYDTEPACRAVVVARSIGAARAFAYMKAIQEAFYRDARDVTQSAVLVDLAADVGYPAETFRALLHSDPLRREAAADFQKTQASGVSGFPTLGVAHEGQLYLVASGFATEDVLEYRLAEIARRVAGAAVKGA